MTEAIKIDDDVRAIADFVERTVPEHRRTGALKAAVELSEILWGSAERVFLLNEVTLKDDQP